MNIRLRSMLNMVECAFDFLADRLRIRRRHVVFGLFVLFLSALITGWYIYEKNWVIVGKRQVGISDEVMTLSLNGEDSAVQEMSKQIRTSILETPMAAASEQSAAQSVSGVNVARSNPQNTEAQSASAKSANSPNSVAAAGSSSSFSPSVSTATSNVKSGEARAETSQQMTPASAQSSAQSASGMNAARSNPQNTETQSASAKSANTPNSVDASGSSSSLSPSVSTASSVKSGEARAETSQKMTTASAQSMAQSASGKNAARSNPQDASAQSASAKSINSPDTASTSGTSSSFTPSVSGSKASASSVVNTSARAETGQSMNMASAQSMAQPASGMNEARSNPQTSGSQSAASADSVSLSSVASATGTSGSFTPSVSGSRAAGSGVKSSSARAESGRAMSKASFKSLSQAATGTQGTARNSPAGASSQVSGSVRAANSSKSVPGSGTSGSFSPSVSGSRAAGSGVRSSDARAESGRAMSAASSQSLAQASTGAQGTARNSPAGTSGRVSGSARAANTSASVAGSGASGSFSPSVSGSRAAGSGVRSSDARAESGRAMSAASSQSLAQASTGAQGSARNNPIGRSGRVTSSVRAYNSPTSVAGAGSRSSFSPSVSGSRAAGSGVKSNGARAIAGLGMSGASSKPSSRVGRSRLGGDKVNTDQVMMQVDSQSMSRPVGFAGIRGRPRSGYVARAVTSESSATPVDNGVTERATEQRSFVPTINTVRTTVPTLEVVRPEPVPEIVQNASKPVDIDLPNSRPVLLDRKPVKPETPIDPFSRRQNPGARERKIDELGGSKATESAVVRALEWFKRNQENDGSWAWRRHDCAATGLVMLAYMGYGAKHIKQGGFEGYQEQLDKAMNWMLSKERKGDMRGGGNMYDHGIAAIAMAEAYYMTKDPSLRPVVQRIVDFTVSAQNPITGGWRYKPYMEKKSLRDIDHFSPLDFNSRKGYVSPGDMSVTGWHIMALKSAQVAGIEVPNEVIDKAYKFMEQKRSSQSTYGYLGKSSATPALVAQGMFCQHILRPHAITRGLASSGEIDMYNRQSAGYIGKHLPDSGSVESHMRQGRKEEYSYYYWYYASLALHQQQGDIWNQWNARMSPVLLKLQESGGTDDGSWAPEGKWGGGAGRVVTTALGALSLEVYYRYLPPTLVQSGVK